MAQNETFEQQVKTIISDCGPGEIDQSAEEIMTLIRKTLDQAKADASNDHDHNAVIVIGKYFNLNLGDL